jgi:ATP-dependent protease ClpP protease subunit
MITVKAETNELYIDGAIGSDWMSEGVTAKAVGESLATIKGRAKIRINSPGGSADEGISIYNMLKRHPGGVDTHNEALAASSASIIFMAGDKRTMERGAKLMIHCTHCVVIGNGSDLQKMAEVLSAYDASMAEIYADAMGLPSDEVLALMADETWYDPAAALASGLATDIAPTVKRKTAAAAAWFKNPPADLFDEHAIEKEGREIVSRISAAKIAEIRARM